MESFMFAEYFMSKEQLVDFATRILKAQDIRELSWDSEKIRYSKNNSDSAIEACKDIDDVEYRILLSNIISRLITIMWNDSQYWSQEVLKKYGDKKNDSSK